MLDEDPAVASQAQYAILAKGLSKSFGGVHATRSVDLAIEAGERHALIGPNGAGKSTLFGLITGEIPPDEGEIHILGRKATRLAVHRRARLGLGRTYQISQLLAELTVEQNLFLAANARSGLGLNLFEGWRDRRPVRDWARDVAGQVGLSEHIGRPVAELAHGLQRQLELGMTLAMRPRLVMLDEPAAGLSPAERQTLCGLIQALPRHITVVLIEHDMDIVMQLSQRITVLHRGAVVAEGPPARIQADPMVQRIYLGGAA